MLSRTKFLGSTCLIDYVTVLYWFDIRRAETETEIGLGLRNIVDHWSGVYYISRILLMYRF